MRERFPIEPAHAFVEALADGLFRFEPEELARSVIHVGDATLRVGHNDAFLDRIEDRLDQSLLLRQLEEIILDVLRPDAAKALDQFIQEAGFHDALIVGASVPARTFGETYQ